jgi:hypothetical protein
MLYREGDLTRSRAFFEEALSITETTLGADHTDTNRVRRSFARLLLATDHPTEALLLGEAALATYEKALGGSHRETRDVAEVTADALRALGRRNDAAVLRARYGLV